MLLLCCRHFDRQLQSSGYGRSILYAGYQLFHFKEEEKLQEKSGYPEREKHYEKHEEFRKTIQELYEYLQEYEGPTDRFSELVQKNVIDWLFGHIKTYDRSVAKFIFMKQNPDRC